MASDKQQEIATRIGPHVVDMEKVIHFPKGLIGFEDKKDFILLQIRPDAPFLVLQSLDQPSLGLLVADPLSFIADYRPRLDKAELAILEAADFAGLSVLVTVSIPPGRPEETLLSFSGPICINHESRIGIQSPQTDGSGLVGTVKLTDLKAAATATG